MVMFLPVLGTCDILVLIRILGSVPLTNGSVPEIIDPVFAKTSQNARFLLSENELFGLVFVKTGSINSGTGRAKNMLIRMRIRNTGISFFKDKKSLKSYRTVER
jgi:hypothetical protein